MIKELRRVVGNHRDAATWQAARCAEAGSVEDDHPHIEPVVRVFVSVTRVPGARRPLKPQERAPIRRAIFTPGERSPVSERQPVVTHPGEYGAGDPAEALVILSNYYPGYWWDHTELSIAVHAHPSATDEQLAAIDAAIETWSTT
jgi:hypothetical protein